MNKTREPKANKLYSTLRNNNLKRGYFLNPDLEFTKDLVRSLLINEDRYSYQACPCRLASGQREEDLDIICPCYYRDADVLEFGNCYCGLYVSQKIFKGQGGVKPIPERRPSKEERQKMEAKNIKLGDCKYPIWRCQVCGYLCSREDAPEICPICGASHDRFEVFGE